jgi:multisubunit Na+/H+ antiporter MnhE subunit
MKKIFVIALVLFLPVFILFAASIGIIDPGNLGNKYAKILAGPYAGTQINFLPTGGSQIVQVHNDRVRGYAWGDATGYIVLSCEDTTSGCVPANGSFKVTNDGSGNLAGYAWGSNTGWISFSCSNPTSSCAGTAGSWGVKINSSGEFVGHAWSQNFGYIQFDCSVSGACVKTDWAPTGGSTGGSSGAGSSSSGGTGVVLIPTTGGSTTGTTTTTGTSTTAGSSTVGTTTAGSNTTSGNTGFSSASTTGTNTGSVSGFSSSVGTTTGTGSSVTGGDTSVGTTTGFSSSTGTSTGFASSTGTSTGFGSSGTSSSGSTTISTTAIGNTGTSSSGNTTGGGRIVFDKYFDKLGDTAGKVIPWLGVFLGLLGALATSLFMNPISLSELIFLPARIWSSILMFFGIAKKPWGIVYDSLTKQPIDPAYVSLIDIATDDEVASSLTDINGRYGFDNVKKGTYKIIANKTHYTFPSTYLAGNKKDEVYEDLYFGETLTIEQDGVLITKNIPMDGQSVDWNEIKKREQNLITFNPIREKRWQKIANFIFIVGFIFSSILVYLYPNLLNKLSIFLYTVFAIILYVLRNPKVRASLSKSHAAVIENKDNMPIASALVEIKNPETGITVAKRVTNNMGLFYALLEKGTYTVHISKPTLPGEYEKVFESNPHTINKGFMDKTFEV